jgi:CHAT domain-containing protein
VPRLLLLAAAIVLPLAIAACGLGFALDFATNFGIPSKEELAAFEDVQRNDQASALIKFENVLAEYERSGQERDAQRVRFFLGTQYVSAGRIDEAEELGKILASEPDFRAAGLSLLQLVRNARGDTEIAVILDNEAAKAWEETFVWTGRLSGRRTYQEAIDLSVEDQHEAAARAWDAAGPIPAGDFAAHKLRGWSYTEVGRYGDAEPALRLALEGSRTLLGVDSPHLVDDFYNLGHVLVRLDKNAEAEALLLKAAQLAVASGRADKTVADVHLELARLRSSEGDLAGALAHSGRATAIHELSISVAASGRPDALGDLQDRGRSAFAFHAGLLERIAQSRGQAPDTAEIIRLIQLAQRSAAAEAALASAVRLGAADPVLADLLAQRQGAVEAWRTADEQMLRMALDAEDPEDFVAVGSMHRRQLDLDETVAELDRQIAQLAPRAVDLVGLRVISLADVQAALSSDEALLLFLVEEETSLVVAVDQRQAQVVRAPMNADAVTSSVRGLRSTLDPTGLARRADIPPFAAEEAHRLYRAFIEPVASLLGGKRHVLVVPDRALASLPLAVLLTSPVAQTLRNLAAHRDLPWLAGRHAFSTLPSASALRALRIEAGRSRASRHFLGIGAPSLPADGVAGVPPLAPLPAAESELRAMANVFDADEATLLIGASATERSVLEANLSDTRVLAFATHALDSDDTQGGEPALVLTPEHDDGLLTATEIAGLVLDADWVVLSACNTAAGGSKAPHDVLSGLARAFLLAGTRSLLVSHWPVVADAAAELTPSLIARAAVADGRSRALALQAAMTRLIDGAAHPDFAHPLFWAPFVVVG